MTKENIVKENNNISKVYTRSVDKLGRGYGTGRGKGHSIAKVWIGYNKSGSTNITMNKMPAIEYLRRSSLVDKLSKPIKTALADSDNVGVDVRIDTFGGGLAGQARAAVLGVARALSVLNPNLRTIMRSEGFLTRDSRVPERQKYGQPGARKQYPYNRR